MPDNDEPVLIDSDLSCFFEENAHTVEVCIYTLEGSSAWSLEVVNEEGTSIVWDETFSSDQEAWDEFVRAIEEEGIEAFLGGAVQ